MLSQLRPNGSGLETISLDDISVLGAMRTRPQSYLSSLSEQVTIDEVQRAPEVLLPLKESVDKNRKAGRYFIIGTANVLMLPKVADTLAERIEIVTLWPFSQGELSSQVEGFIPALFSQEPLPRCSGIDAPELFKILVTGGYPEAVQRPLAGRRDAWFQGYITTIFQRDVRNLSNIEGLTALPNFLSLIGTRSGGLLNAAELSRSIGIPNMTLHRYLNLLEALYLIISIRP